MDNPWISMDNPWISMDNPWISMDDPWIYMENPFVTKWHAIQIERISTRPISMILSVRICADFEIFKFPLFNFLNFYGFLFDFGRHHGPPRISFGAAGATRDNFGGILCSSDFSRNSKIKKKQLLSVSRDGFRRTKRESMQNRGPVIFQPSVS